MGDYFEIDEDHRQFLIGVWDDMLDENNFGKKCQLIYSTSQTICPNCIINPRTGESTNVYKEGGPIPFEDEECPVCDGRGRIAGTDNREDVIMSIDWEPKPWLNVGSGAGLEGDRLVRVPGGTALTRGFSTDLPKVLRADYVVLDIDNNMVKSRHKLLGEPYILGSISKNRYFIALWEKSK